MSTVLQKPEYDVILIGTGVGGLYQLYRLKQLGLKTLALEAGSDVGGVWYWNRYPGARLDSESYSYAYTFSEELLEEWDWPEHFAAQPVLLSYYQHVSRKFGLRDLIRFDSRVTFAHFDEVKRLWRLGTEDGATFTARFVITAVGPLSTPVYPRIPGRESFQGIAYHTSRWPFDAESFNGKRVAVIGTGSTGVQVIQEAAKTAASLVVFQRTPNYCAPLKNETIGPESQAALKARYPEVIETCRRSNSWFLHNADPRSVFDVSESERVDFLENLYYSRGLGIWKANFRDVATDPAANAVVSDFMRRKIRERVEDPVTAERLVPKDHGFAARRVPLETNYYEVYNQDNVTLVSVLETPIEEITPTGIQTTGENFDVDMIIYATGFDAVTGSYERIDFQGHGGAKLKDKWEDGPVNFLGVHVSGFPNCFMVGGPLSSLGNYGPALEYSVNWVTGVLEFMIENGLDYIDVEKRHEDAYLEHVYRCVGSQLMAKTKSWVTGVNTNLDGRDKIRIINYIAGAQSYREICDQVKAGGYREFTFDCDEAPIQEPETASAS